MGQKTVKLNKLKKTSRGKTHKNKVMILDVPNTIQKDIYKLLWLDRNPAISKIELTNASILNITLRNIMITHFGASSDILDMKCFAICGPTAVGKTKFINYLKNKYNVEIVDMDTMQVYKDISVGTGRTNLADTKGSYIYGVYNPNIEFHIVDYLIDVFKAMRKIKDNGNIPIFEGASKSLLDVLMCIFPNLTVFGIKAINKTNISERVTLRISRDFVVNSILELSECLQNNKINYNSPVLLNNWVVYKILVSNFSKSELMDTKLSEKINTVYYDKISQLTNKCVKANIRLHLMQFERLKTIPNVAWFTNDDKSIKLLESNFRNKLKI